MRCVRYCNADVNGAPCLIGVFTRSHVVSLQCADMYDDIYAMADDYMSNKYSVDQICLMAKMCPSPEKSTCACVCVCACNSERRVLTYACICITPLSLHHPIDRIRAVSLTLVLSERVNRGALCAVCQHARDGLPSRLQLGSQAGDR